MNIKKIFCIFSVTSIVLFLFGICALAYEEDEYEIDIPETYIEKRDSDIKMFTKFTSNFSILVKRNNDKINIVELNQEQIKNMTDDIDKALEEANMPNEIISAEHVKVNDYDALLIKNTCKKNEQDEEYIFQYKYILTSENYVYYITYSTASEEDFKEFENILKTFKIKDEIYTVEMEKAENNNTSVSQLQNAQAEKNNFLNIVIIMIVVLIILLGATVIVLMRLKK